MRALPEDNYKVFGSAEAQKFASTAGRSASLAETTKSPASIQVAHATVACRRARIAALLEIGDFPRNALVQRAVAIARAPSVTAEIDCPRIDTLCARPSRKRVPAL